ncbi:MAG: hypothetical protein AB7F35_23975 [Acetobacteraceae bacterium]
MTSPSSLALRPLLPARRAMAAIMRWRSRRGRRVNRTRDWLISGGCLAVGIAVGLSALPTRPGQLFGAITLMDPQRSDSSVAPAVFALRESGAAVRFGNAEAGPAGTIRVGFYDGLDSLLATATDPISLPGDARLLWFLASHEERQILRDKTAALVLAVSTSARDILTSTEFVQFYRDRFADVFQAALRTAWQKTQEQGAWRALIRSYEPILRDLTEHDIRPILDRHFRGVPMAMLRANVLGLIDPFRDHPWNTQPIEEALKAGVMELRDRDVPEHAMMRLMEAPQTVDFLRVFQDELVRALAHDPALQGLLAEMVFDERFRPYVAGAIARANDLSRSAPQLLVSLHGSRELNLVAASVIRTTISGRQDRVIVYMSPAQREQIIALDPVAVHRLVRVDER